ncbi:hypothetical protein EX895_003917 [Sporisorium graminicola]|uniref:Palmitoyltransferase n=1 Tax=Sporisorium graminicola TaxID=280036 RepID=A0A4U7KS23_9BASI|nr:hypothetical protein EX895_003917 [Sporisorium graminicola]TKY87240.1 hypothetical protein EX895_003917 [Sporisorium graminicola]
MVSGAASSDIDDRTTSALSTSSQTHVDLNDAHPHSPRSKMKAWSTSYAEPAGPAAENEVHPQKTVPASATSMGAPALDTSRVGQPTTGRRHKRADRPPPPRCMESCIESIESCTQNIVRFNERMEISRVQAEQQRRDHGDPPAARKAIIPLVFVILSWVFLAYVWRLCSRLIQQNPQGAVLGSRKEGIGLLVGFVILWLVTIWSYVVVISRGPGLVKDYVPESDPPAANVPAEHRNDALTCAQPYQQSTTGPVPIPGQSRPSTDLHATRASGSNNGHATTPAPSTSLPYPSFNADLESFGGYRASSDSMRVLPGSMEPKHEARAAELSSHSPDLSRSAIEEENSDAAAEVSAAVEEEQLGAETSPPTDDVDASDIAADPQLPGLIGPLAAAALAEGQGMREGARALERLDDAEHTAPAPPGPDATQTDAATTSGWAAPQRTPQNDPPPLSAAALYCHRCRRVKPPRAHHCRRCGTCVLKMDHHCPWVGGCVGAHNQRFFFIFVFWVTLLELYTLVTTAVFFRRGVRSLGAPVRSAWRVDGFLISLFPISGIFLIFTGALLCTHVFLMAHNLTTIEHVGVNRVQGRERVLLDRWFGMQRKGGLGGVKQKRLMRKEWDRKWGRWTSEANRWWLGGSDEVHFDDTDDRGKQPEQPDVASISGAQEKQQDARSKSSAGGRRRGAFRTNIEQALGPSMWMWILPLGKHPNEGLEFPMNPRFGREGVWRERQDWPPALR